MTETDFDEYLKNRYEDQIGWYDRKARTSQRMYQWMQWSTIMLAAVTPVLVEVALDPDWQAYGHVPTITSAAVAILTAGLKAFKYQENWISYRTTCETLRKEKPFYDAGLDDYKGAEDREGVFVERVERLISRENTLWLSVHKTEGRQEKAQSRSSG